jgi:hypothetical protein
MTVLPAFLGGMSLLFVVAAIVLLAMTVVQAARRRAGRAAAYLGLTILASFVAAGFYFFRALI